MDLFRQLDNTYSYKWKCRTVILKPKQYISGPIEAIHTALLFYADRHFMPGHTVVHVILTQNNGTAGFTLSRNTDKTVITLDNVRTHLFMERELGTLAQRILNSNENWVLDSGARLMFKYFFVPKEILDEYRVPTLSNKRKWQEEAEADRTGYDSNDDSESEIDV